MRITRQVLALVLLCTVLVATPGTARAADDTFVRPFDPGRFNAGLPADGDSVRIRATMANANKYALTTWYHTVKDYDAQPGTYIDFGGAAEIDIRGASSQAYALAVALATGGYDAAATGVSEATARSVAVRLTRSLAFGHLVNSGSGWGYGSQTALWAAQTGTAGWLLWSSLPATDRQYVGKMIEFEANRFIGWPLPYWKNREGGRVRPCDNTAGEESSWNARLLFLAGAMFTRHSRRSGWAYKANELSIGAFARPADVTNNSNLRGRPVTDWLEGTNINDDGTVVNHNRYHADYAATATEMFSGAVVHALAGDPVPVNALHNVDRLYDGLVDKQWVPAPARPCPTSPAFEPPGPGNPTGTMYIDGSGDVYHPEGNDWGYGRRAHFVGLDVIVRTFGRDNLVAEKAVTWERLHAQQVLDMQRRPLLDGSPTDGRTYRLVDEDRYTGREEWVAAQICEAWMIKWLAHQGALHTTNKAEQIVVDNTDRGVTVAGSWSTGNPATKGPQVFGPSVRHKAPGTGAASIRFTPRMTQTRSFQVYAWWMAAPAHATNAPFTIGHRGGTAVVTRNQRTAGGAWNLLGTFTLGPGDYVQLGDNANGDVVADAILLNPT